MTKHLLSTSLVELAHAVGGRTNVAHQCGIPEVALNDWAFGVGAPSLEQWETLFLLAERAGVSFPPPPGRARERPSSGPPRRSIEEEQPLSEMSSAKRARRPIPITVLVVDDDPRFRGAIRELLERGGFEVEEAGDGVEALHKMKSAGLAPDLLVTDLKMPGMGGTELLAALQSSRLLASIPTIVVSAYLTSPEVAGARKAIRKDQTLSSLVEDLRALVGRPSPVSAGA